METLDEEQMRAIVRYRLAIARAAQPDSMAWWEDQSLTRGAEGLLARLFPRSAPLAASRLAVLAAGSWHQRTLEGCAPCEHLYFLGEETELLLDQHLDDLAERPFAEPITDSASLRERLLAIGPEPSSQVSGEGRLRSLPAGLSDRDAVEKAAALAWAYLQGRTGAPVAPYIPGGAGA